MKPLWEIYKVDDATGKVAWVLDGQMLKHPVTFSSLNLLQQYMDSFHETVNKERKQMKMRSGDASSPKHPYDRENGYWEMQDEKVD